MPLQRIEFRAISPQKTVSCRHLLRCDTLAFQFGIAFRHQNLEGRMPRPLSISRQYRAMPHVRTVAAIDGRHILHRIEISPPVLRNRSGIVEIRFVKIFHIRRIAREQIRIVLVFLHHDAHLFLCGNDGNPFPPGFRQHACFPHRPDTRDRTDTAAAFTTRYEDYTC